LEEFKEIDLKIVLLIHLNFSKVNNIEKALDIILLNKEVK
jgi:hypothetical protein